MPERLKNLFSLLIRVGLSGALLIWLFSKIDYKHTWEAVKGADMIWMLAALGVFLATVFIIFLRWRLLMKTVGLKVTRFNSLRWFLIGQFYNLCLPTSVGGDVVKAIGLARECGNKPKVIASIVLDRMSGFTGIVITAAVSFLFGRAIVNNHAVAGSIMMMTAFSLGLALVLFSQRIFTTICRLFNRLPRIKDGLLRLHDDVILLRGQAWKGAESVALSVAAQVTGAFGFYLTAKAMHQDIGLLYFIIFSPLVCVATSLPSIGGLGVREVGWKVLLGQLGVRPEIAVGLSLINFAFMVIVGLFGGLLYVVTLSPGRVQHHPSNAQLGRSITG